jgi:hypothetical protein
MSNVYVNSGYARLENDNYQTVDSRCVESFVKGFFLDHIKNGDYNSMPTIVDMCGSHGSGIVRDFQNLGFKASYLENAFVPIYADWIVTNPPYDRKVVDKFANHALNSISKGNVLGAAFLMRANWDFAMTRADLFDRKEYYGQIRMRFRPWWTEERKAQPIHNYVWHIWMNVDMFSGEPKIIYHPKKKTG